MARKKVVTKPPFKVEITAVENGLIVEYWCGGKWGDPSSVKRYITDDIDQATDLTVELFDEH